MICPKCRAEYVSGVTACYDCGVELVQVLPPPEPKPAIVPAPPSAPLIDPVCIYLPHPGQPLGILQAESLLQSAGIPFVYPGEHGAVTERDGPVGLFVAAADAADARQLLMDPDSED